MTILRFSALLLLVVVSGSLIAPQASRAATLYDCTFEKMRSRGGGWVPDQLFVLHDAETGEVEVLDPIINHFVGNPIAGKVMAETKVRIRFGWSVAITDNLNQSTDMDYSFTYFKDGRKAQIAGKPGDYENNFSASGTCKLGKR
ncbi:MAG: hypothetical protein ACRC14_03925 [Paracoccaceae bacterium]